MKIKCLKCGNIVDEKDAIKEAMFRGLINPRHSFFCSEKCSKEQSEVMTKYWKDSKNAIYWAFGGFVVAIIILFIWLTLYPPVV